MGWLRISIFELKELYENILPLATGKISEFELNHLDVNDKKIKLNQVDGIKHYLD